MSAETHKIDALAAPILPTQPVRAAPPTTKRPRRCRRGPLH